MTEAYSPSFSTEQYVRYLSLLQRRPAAPSLTALKVLVEAQLTRVPFENVSKLYYLKKFGLRGIPSFEQYLAGIERYHFGGTCYSNNFYFGELLRHLGYEARLCGADMTNPDVHVVNLVRIEEREYLVDVGYGAPFLEPMPRDLPDDFVTTLGHDRYVLKPQDSEGRSRLDLYRGGTLVHGYTVKPTERTIDHFAPAVEASYRPQATFMNALLLARYAPNQGTVMHNLTVIEIEGSQVTTRTLAGREAIPAEVEKLFQIPREIVAEAVQPLGEFTNPWS